MPRRRQATSLVTPASWNRSKPAMHAKSLLLILSICMSCSAFVPSSCCAESGRGWKRVRPLVSRTAVARKTLPPRNPTSPEDALLVKESSKLMNNSDDSAQNCNTVAVGETHESSREENSDPTLSPTYHRKRRMVLAATGLLGKAAQIYSRYLSRLWKETNREARQQSRHQKIVTSMRQLSQLLVKEQEAMSTMASTVKSSVDNHLSGLERDDGRVLETDSAALAMMEQLQKACKEYLDYETARNQESTAAGTALPSSITATTMRPQLNETAISSDQHSPSSALVAVAGKPDHSTVNKLTKKKNRRSIGFGALMGLAVAGMVFSGGYVFTGIFTLMAVLGQLEYYRMVMNTGVLPARRISIIGSASMFITAMVAPSLHEVCLPLFGLYTMIWFLTMRRTVSTIPEIATTFSGMFYLGYVPSFWVRIRQTGSHLPPTSLTAQWPWLEPHVRALATKVKHLIPASIMPSAINLPMTATSGAVFVFWTWLCIAFSDVGAYFVGKSYGNTKLGRVLPAAGDASPNKTVEGVLGGCIVSALLGVLGAWAQQWPYYIWTGALHGVMLALCGLIGDLTASMLKRDAGLKDFGDLLPEHGGIMDRVDSYIWTAPYSWLVISYVLPALRKSSLTAAACL